MFKRNRIVARLALAGVVVSALLGAAVPVFAAGAATIRMAPALYSGEAVNYITIQVYANTWGQQMRGYQFGLTYDRNVIDIVSIVEGPFMRNWAIANGGGTTSATGGWNTADNTGTVAPAGYAVTGAIGAGGVVGEGIIATITVQALRATAAGGTWIRFSDAFLANQNGVRMTPLTQIESLLYLSEPPPIPDLIVESVNVVADPFDANKYRVQAVVKNQGGVDAGASSLRVRVDGTVLETLSVGPLGIGAKQTVTTTGQATLSPPDDVIEACADSVNVVVESNEFNNCLSLAYSPIAATDDDATSVNAGLQKYILVRAPADIPHATWPLKIGANAMARHGAQGLGVLSNAGWTVTAADLDAATAGRMREHNGAGYTTPAKQLSDALQVLSGANELTLPLGGTLRTGGPNTTDDWQDISVTFAQNVRFGDRALDAASSWYQIAVTFAGATAF